MCEVLQDIHIINHEGEERVIRAVRVHNVVFVDNEVTVRYGIGKLLFTITFPKRGHTLTID